MKKIYIKPLNEVIKLDDEFMEGPTINSGNGYEAGGPGTEIDPKDMEGKEDDFDDDDFTPFNWDDDWNSY